MNFYKHFIGDYQRKTGALSLAEHGAYRLMLDTYYATQEPLPLDRKDLYRLIRAEGSLERAAVDKVAVKFWKETLDGLINLRASEEIERANHLASVSREVGKLGGRPKRTQSKPADNPAGSLAVTQAEPADNPSHSHSQKELQKPKAERGTRLPDGWRPSDAALAWAGKDRPEIDVNAATASFADYWRAKAGKDGISLDWDATWRNWIRKERVPANGSRFPPRNDRSAAARTMFGTEPTREVIDV